VLSLKLLCGFSIKEIAARLFITTANAEKILGRGRARLREVWEAPHGSWSTPPAEQLAERLAAVQAVVYLLFNEGYKSQRDDQVIRRELCEEALRLGQRLVSHRASDSPASWALLALMHFHIARLDARLDEHGELLMLEEQDRSRWDRQHLRRAMTCLVKAGEGERFSRYHAEAAIMAEHCLAPTYADTRWSEIVDLYQLLERFEPSPLHTLNRAIAVAEWKGPEAGLALLDELTPPGWLTRYYLWDATLGELHRRAGNFDRAAAYLERASGQAPTQAERKVFAERLALCRRGDSRRGRARR
jgi:RNA polymerase sigma-70 factor (ECF subfamily)